MSDDFFGLFEEKRHGNNYHDRSRRDHPHHDDHLYEDDDRHYRHRDNGHGNFDPMLLKSFGQKILGNKLLMAGIIIVLIFVFIGVTALAIAFFPVIVRIFDFILNNGLKGIIEIIQSFLNLLAQGSGK